MIVPMMTRFQTGLIYCLSTFTIHIDIGHIDKHTCDVTLDN